MDDPRLKKLRFRAWHRGFREADLILGPFADAHLEQLSQAQLDSFEALIDQPDQDLYGWITGALATPEAFEGEVLDLIRGFRFFAHAALGADHGG
jgi:antitoxin CptB